MEDQDIIAYKSSFIPNMNINLVFKENPNYKGIEFIEPGMSTNCHALYRVGWFKTDEGK